MDFKQWIKDDLNIDFEKGTSILYVKYKNTDKDLIINVLNMISKKYKDYSRKEQQKTTSSRYCGISFPKNAKLLGRIFLRYICGR